jgi:hypothetical protein
VRRLAAAAITDGKRSRNIANTFAARAPIAQISSPASSHFVLRALYAWVCELCMLVVPLSNIQSNSDGKAAR